MYGKYADNIISHFNHIFGVNDDVKGMFSFGTIKAQKRQGEAYKVMGSMLTSAIKVTKEGEQALTEAKLQ